MIGPKCAGIESCWPDSENKIPFGHSPFGVPGWSQRPSNCPASLGKQRSGPRPSPPVCLFTIAGSVFASLTTRKPIQNVGGADKERGNRVSLILPVASERRAVSVVYTGTQGKTEKRRADQASCFTQASRKKLACPESWEKQNLPVPDRYIEATRKRPLIETELIVPQMKIKSHGIDDIVFIPESNAGRLLAPRLMVLL